MSFIKNRSIFQDIHLACTKYPIWLHLGVQDVKQRYRRSILGPWWITINMAIFISAMGVIFGRVLSQSATNYIPFFTAGFLLWSFISGSIIESTELFKSHSGFIKQMRLPLNLYVFKFFTKNIIVFFHNFVVYLFVALIFKVVPGFSVLLAIPGLVLMWINLYWICLFVALISTRYRDMVPIINSTMQLMFFVTPVSWMPKLVGENSIIIKWNPFVYFIEVVRQPLLGDIPPYHYWVVNCSIAIVGICVSFWILQRVKSRIPFWVD